MPISVSCQDCGKSLKAPDSLAGKRAKCPECGAVVPIPAADVELEVINEPPPKFDAAVDDNLEAPAVDRKPCPMCGEIVAAAALKCRFCGEAFEASSVAGRPQSRSSSGYAGFWIRFVAAIIDFFPVAILSGVISGILGARGSELIFVLMNWLYYSLQESSANQATLGKRLMHLRVSDLDGGRISFVRATGRHFGKILSGMILMIGFLMAAFTEKKQALHDMLAGTLVVKD